MSAGRCLRCRHWDDHSLNFDADNGYRAIQDRPVTTFGGVPAHMVTTS
jgi:hypothetical protein